MQLFEITVHVIEGLWRVRASWMLIGWSWSWSAAAKSSNACYGILPVFIGNNLS